MDKQALSVAIKRMITDSGFDHAGFAKAELLERDYDFLVSWLAKGNHAAKGYLERDPLKRADPRRLVEGARSVISILFPYYTGEDLSEQHFYRISKYGYGRDYHLVLKEKLNEIAGFIESLTSSSATFAYVDAAPVLEKAWAQRCGLGWAGKNTLLISPGLGSFHFIGTIITDVELDYDVAAGDACGHCRLCLDACPTGALTAAREIDIRLCISHLTMEQKNALPEARREAFGRYIYGCDICQDCCPYNQKLRVDCAPEFFASEALRQMGQADWEGLSAEAFERLFAHSAVKRVGYEALMRNIAFVGGQK